ncbi:unnamed protein product, partial [Pleuronectes platessa]
ARHGAGCAMNGGRREHLRRDSGEQHSISQDPEYTDAKPLRMQRLAERWLTGEQQQKYGGDFHRRRGTHVDLSQEKTSEVDWSSRELVLLAQRASGCQLPFPAWRGSALGRGMSRTLLAPSVRGEGVRGSSAPRGEMHGMPGDAAVRPPAPATSASGGAAGRRRRRQEVTCYFHSRDHSRLFLFLFYRLLRTPPPEKIRRSRRKPLAFSPTNICFALRSRGHKALTAARGANSALHPSHTVLPPIVILSTTRTQAAQSITASPSSSSSSSSFLCCPPPSDSSSALPLKASTPLSMSPHFPTSILSFPFLPHTPTVSAVRPLARSHGRCAYIIMWLATQPAAPKQPSTDGSTCQGKKRTLERADGDK